jgi:hypothetical protein
MKDQRKKPNTVKSAASSDKPLQARYRELLDLREEVRDAERRSSRGARKVEKPAGKANRDF